jgi:hypothetical protein
MSVAGFPTDDEVVERSDPFAGTLVHGRADREQSGLARETRTAVPAERAAKDSLRDRPQPNDVTGRSRSRSCGVRMNMAARSLKRATPASADGSIACGICAKRCA